MLSNKQNQKNFKARKKDEGKKRAEYWLKPKQKILVDRFVAELFMIDNQCKRAIKRDSLS